MSFALSLLICTCELLFLFLLLFFVALPVLVIVFPNIITKLFFLNFRRIPMTDYSNVSSNNVLSIGRSFYLDGDEGNIGVWHILPSSMSADYREKGVHPADDEMEKSLSSEKYPVMLYLHGNSFDRTIGHRVEMYNVLSNLKYHVVAFDYRGYGDSDGNPSEGGLVNDSRLVYDYVKKHSGNNTLIIWGHSMGTGVAVKLAMDLSVDGQPPDGLILESPFNNLRDAIMNHVLGIPFRWMTEEMVQKFIMSPLRRVGLDMNSDQRIANVTCPILILHAENDHVVPVILGRRLKSAAVAASRDVKYVEFEEARNYKHKFIYLAPELSSLIPEFVAYTKRAKKSRKVSR